MSIETHMENLHRETSFQTPNWYPSNNFFQTVIYKFRRNTEYRNVICWVIPPRPLYPYYRRQR